MSGHIRPRQRSTCQFCTKGEIEHVFNIRGGMRADRFGLCDKFMGYNGIFPSDNPSDPENFAFEYCDSCSATALKYISQYYYFNTEFFEMFYTYASLVGFGVKIRLLNGTIEGNYCINIPHSTGGFYLHRQSLNGPVVVSLRNNTHYDHEIVVPYNDLCELNAGMPELIFPHDEPTSKRQRLSSNDL